jgi:hypothetical protein
MAANERRGAEEGAAEAGGGAEPRDEKGEAGVDADNDEETEEDADEGDAQDENEEDDVAFKVPVPCEKWSRPGEDAGGGAVSAAEWPLDCECGVATARFIVRRSCE